MNRSNTKPSGFVTGGSQEETTMTSTVHVYSVASPSASAMALRATFSRRDRSDQMAEVTRQKPKVTVHQTRAERGFLGEVVEL